MSNYEHRHPDDMVMHPLTEIREWDEALAVLGIQDSTQTPADAIRKLNAEIEALTERLKPQRQIADELEAWIIPRRYDAARGLSDIHGPVFDNLLERIVLTLRGVQP